jgi:hypothetical protein
MILRVLYPNRRMSPKVLDSGHLHTDDTTLLLQKIDPARPAVPAHRGCRETAVLFVASERAGHAAAIYDSLVEYATNRG